MNINQKDLRVGELARRTGLTVRTLHHWDHVGLLSPSKRTAAGHRLYGSSEVKRLQTILSLRALGLSLDGIGSLLRDGVPSLEVVLAAHRDRVREQIDFLLDLDGRLGWILGLLSDGGIVTQGDFLKTMEKMAMIERHFSPEQLEALARRWKSLIQAFSGGDSQVEGSVARMYQAEPNMAAQQGLDPALFGYIGAAMRAGTEGG